MVICGFGLVRGDIFLVICGFFLVRGGFDSEGYGFFLVRGGFGLVICGFFSEGGDIFRSPAVLTRKAAVFFGRGTPYPNVVDLSIFFEP